MLQKCKHGDLHDQHRGGIFRAWSTHCAISRYKQVNSEANHCCVRPLGIRYPGCPSNEQPTAHDAVDQQEVFRIIHPFHPLFGREFVLIERRSAWGEERVYFHDDTGRLRRLTATWTSAVAPGRFETVSAGRSHFRIDDLLHLAALIARQNEGKKSVKAISRSRKVSSK